MTDFKVFPYTFDNLTRIGNDNCSLDQRNIQNAHSSNYMTENFYPACPMSSAIDFATNQPNVFYKGSHQMGINGCNVAENSELKYTKITKPACKISLEQRPFLTVPYLGRGIVDPVLERQIKTGDTELNRKSINPSSEVSHTERRNYPLLGNIEKTVTNPDNLIEESAQNGWVRGGMSSRDYTRQNNNQ